jgi:dienelactone hydrolase
VRHPSDLRPRPEPCARVFLLLLGLALFGGCGGIDHHLVHPRVAPPEVVLWSGDFERDQLRVHVEGARPPGRGPFPTVLVHPEEEATAADMRGVIWDLATHGYAAIAAGYQRLIDGKWQRSMFAWRSTGDLTLIMDATLAYPEVDQARIGALGFSEGAVVSLLMAANEPDRLKAVVAYYPITDFPYWYAGKRSGLSDRIMFALAKWQLRDESGTHDDEALQSSLRLASPIYMAEFVKAPVLFVHGARDTMLPLEESQRMADKIKAAGGTAEVMVIPEGGRLFNFHDRGQATTAWQATVDWLDRYVRPATPTGGG